MSHDLRSPLNSIIGFTGLLQSQLQDTLSDKHRRFLANISSSAHTLLSLIDLVVDVALLGESRADGQPDVTGLPVVVDSCVRLTNEYAQGHGVSILASTVRCDAPLRGGSARLLWALVQLVHHTVDMLGPGAGVRMEPACNPDGLAASVRVVGIPRETGTNSSPQTEGVEVGPRLEEAARHLRHMGGHVDYEGISVGGGFAFSVSFPLHGAHPGEEGKA